MESIKDKVAIVGMGCTKFGERWDASTEDLLVEACYEAYEDAGIEPQDIQAAWAAAVYTLNNTLEVARSLKLNFVPITHVENACASGSEALRGAAYAVASGVCDIALACGVEKNKDSGFSGLTTPSGPGLLPLTIVDEGPVVGFALAATRYFAYYGLSIEEGKRILAKLSVKNHHNGTLSPKAHFHREITEEMVMNAPMISYPLGLYDCCGVSDGAAAAIIVRKDMAKNFRKDPVFIKAMAISTGPRQNMLLDDYDFTHFIEAGMAAKMAYSQAGITNPRDDIDLAEVHDCFTITELITMEDLGFSPKGKAAEDVKAGLFNLDGGLPVNSDGGLKCFGHPVGATGIRMAYEIYKQLQGKADKRQLKKIDLGLTHNLGGRPDQGFICSIVILGN